MCRQNYLLKIAQKIFLALLVLSIIHTPILAEPVAAQDETLPVYIVQSGDTLFDIANQFYTTVDEILAVNGLSNGDTLLVGDRLLIPGLEGMQGTLTTEIIPLGANLRSLSRRTQSDPASLAKLNKFTSQSELFVGRRIALTTSEATQDLQMLPALTPGQSWLEFALLSGQNPWALARLNQLSSPNLALPLDPYFHHSGQEATEVLAIPGIRSMSIDNLPLMQGETYVLKAEAAESVSISAELAGNSAVFSPYENRELVAFGGINALQAPGAYPLKITVTTAENITYNFDQWVIIKPGIFQSSIDLIVDPETIDSPEIAEEDARVREIVTKVTPIKQWNGTFKYPIAGSDCVNADFGSRRTYNGSDKLYYHTGIDLGYCEGTDVFAPATGTVAAILPNQLVRGNLLIIDHGLGVYSIYMHLSEILVDVGEVVQPGQRIAILGNTGRSTGPHLHFEIDINGTPVSPWTWFNREFP